MNSKNRFFTIILLLGILFASSAFAQPIADQKQLFSELRAKICEFQKNEVLPFMHDWKTQLDNSMESADLAKLNELRAKAAEMKKTMKMGPPPNGPRGMGNPNCNPSDCDKTKCKKQNCDPSKCDKSKCGMMGKGKMGQFGAIMKDLAPLADKYSASLKTIGESAKPKVEEWAAGIKKIVNDWRASHKNEFENLHMQGKFGIGDMHFGLAHRFDFNRPHLAAMFMLWDGSDLCSGQNPPDPLFGLAGVDAANDEQASGNYPNPFADKTTISFEMPQREKVTISIIDPTGNIVAVLFKGELSGGPQNFIFDVTKGSNANLGSGTYIYKIEGESFTKTGKMLLQR